MPVSMQKIDVEKASNTHGHNFHTSAELDQGPSIYRSIGPGVLLGHWGRGLAGALWGARALQVGHAAEMQS